MIRQLGTGKRVALHWFLGLAIWWSKRLSPKQLQSDDSIEAKFSNFLVHPVYLLRRTTKLKLSVGCFHSTQHRPAQRVTGYCCPRLSPTACPYWASPHQKGDCSTACALRSQDRLRSERLALAPLLPAFSRHISTKQGSVGWGRHCEQS